MNDSSGGRLRLTSRSGSTRGGAAGWLPLVWLRVADLCSVVTMNSSAGYLPQTRNGILKSKLRGWPRDLLARRADQGVGAGLLDRPPEPLAQVDRGLPAQDLPGQRDIGLA